MVRPVGVLLMVFSLLSLIVHQTGMFELLGGAAAALLAVDAVTARSSKSARATSLRDPLL